MVELAVKLALGCWILWILGNAFLFLIGVIFARYDKPTFDGFRIHMPGRFAAIATTAELSAAIMHEYGHQKRCHVWENLLRLFLFCPVSIKRRMVQELEADAYVTDPESLASFLRKVSDHPFDLMRARRLDARAAEAGLAGCGQPYARDARVPTQGTP